MKNTSFLDYYKKILQKVSFDTYLLNKEYLKAINTLHPNEIEEFEQWVASAEFQNKLNEAAVPTSMDKVG